MNKICEECGKLFHDPYDDDAVDMCDECIDKAYEEHLKECHKKLH